MNWMLTLVALVACGAPVPAPAVSNRANRTADGIPPWPVAVDAAFDANCQPGGLLQQTFPGWSGELCGIITPSSSADQSAATWHCVEAARHAARPFIYYRVETLRADDDFGIGYIGVPHAGSIDVYRVDYMADPCSDSGGCPARGGAEIVTCTKFFPICDRLDCFECDGQRVVAVCRAGKQAN
jgi:hypothetical protein